MAYDKSYEIALAEGLPPFRAASSRDLGFRSPEGRAREVSSPRTGMQVRTF